ncbi:Site-specific recombinase [Alloactinosynnema sp. L-07]|uniref:recombinase family protein n=1 Tax=Alloactinosynnema sp. L-07 TaxID=1653480 RepID=UPI00065F044C|nr:recombinase family protein [Alloactinosynnema sp. L-07]CRK56783.1 Site-specific recombinase [Alloactinosynnema sp. L-07]
MTLEISRNPWATLDDLLGIEVETVVDDGIGPLGFYGRCSTEDNQDPETSHGWQLGNARKFVEPLGGSVVAEFFDIGQSRSVPWDRRHEAARLLAALKDPDRGWNALVVGEGTRCWFGNQFSLIAPRFAAYGVDLWVPELGGKFDPKNPSHKMLMSVLGGMSESERQHVQARVRAAMDAQVINEGRHQGGRAPYGYVVVDGGPHPNPRKAAEGFRLRLLAIDDGSAEAVRRIFGEYLDGAGDRAIANGLNRDGIPCPSARRPDQNRHRLADGWQGSTVRAILENPRYTGYAVFGRWVKHETLVNPDDVAAGHVVRFRRSEPDRIVRSRQQAHPEIVTVEVFTLTPGSAALDEHPKTVNLREDHIVPALNEWLGERFSRENIEDTVAGLFGSQDATVHTGKHENARKRLQDAETRLKRHTAAISAGVDPMALVEAINDAQADREAARAELAVTPAEPTLTEAQVRALVDKLGDVGAKIETARPERLPEIYAEMGLELRFEQKERAVYVTARPRVVSECVRGGTRTRVRGNSPGIREISCPGLYQPALASSQVSHGSVLRVVAERYRRDDDVLGCECGLHLCAAWMIEAYLFRVGAPKPKICSSGSSTRRAHFAASAPIGRGVVLSRPRRW